MCDTEYQSVKVALLKCTLHRSYEPLNVNIRCLPFNTLYFWITFQKCTLIVNRFP